MTKKNQTSENPVEEKTLEQLKEESTAKKVEQILVEDEMGLQPFLQVTENGVIPRVRLVALKKDA